MLTIWINGDQHEGIDEGWIARRVQGLRHDGDAVCVRVTVKSDGVDMVLVAGSCTSGVGTGRQANQREDRLFRLWDESGLRGDPDFPPGQLIQALKRLERAL